ncbi:hypothetical protein B0H66DRAFT_271458 [Apodospora peruviana]|uniref:Uncharacterized protein n=1 Tax=Apodospora peruviana TaxID=516989 RepID=A0AAE0M1Q2_9PEZI|nr:hypothetical protein B0H66DRAFT_271458 [Apodospora peruviana]
MAAAGGRSVRLENQDRRRRRDRGQHSKEDQAGRQACGQIVMFGQAGDTEPTADRRKQQPLKDEPRLGEWWVWYSLYWLLFSLSRSISILCMYYLPVGVCFWVSLRGRAHIRNWLAGWLYGQVWTFLGLPYISRIISVERKAGATSKILSVYLQRAKTHSRAVLVILSRNKWIFFLVNPGDPLLSPDFR